MIGPWPLGRLIARIQDALAPWIDRKIDVAIPLAFDYYLDADADPIIAGYKVAAATPPTGADAPLAVACAAANTLIQAWITGVGEPNTREIPEGIVQVQISAAKTAGTKGAFIYAQIYARTAAGAETLLGTSGNSGLLAAGASSLPLHMLVALTPVDPTDRLVLKIYGSPSGAGTVPTVTLHVEGATLARFEVQVRPVSVTPAAHAASHVTGADQLADAIPGAPGTHGLLTGVDKTKIDALGTAATHAEGDFEATGVAASLDALGVPPKGTATGGVRAKGVDLTIAEVPVGAGATIAITPSVANNFRCPAALLNTAKVVGLPLDGGVGSSFTLETVQPNPPILLTWHANYKSTGGAGIPAATAVAGAVDQWFVDYSSGLAAWVVQKRPVG